MSFLANNKSVISSFSFSSFLSSSVGLQIPVNQNIIIIKKTNHCVCKTINLSLKSVLVASLSHVSFSILFLHFLHSPFSFTQEKRMQQKKELLERIVNSFFRSQCSGIGMVERWRGMNVFLSVRCTKFLIFFKKEEKGKRRRGKRYVGIEVTEFSFKMFKNGLVNFEKFST